MRLHLLCACTRFTLCVWSGVYVFVLCRFGLGAWPVRMSCGVLTACRVAVGPLVTACRSLCVTLLGPSLCSVINLLLGTMQSFWNLIVIVASTFKCLLTSWGFSAIGVTIQCSTLVLRVGRSRIAISRRGNGVTSDKHISYHFPPLP